MQGVDGSNHREVTKQLLLLSLPTGFPNSAAFELRGSGRWILSDPDPRSRITGDPHQNAARFTVIENVDRYLTANSYRADGAPKVRKGVDLGAIECDQVLPSVKSGPSPNAGWIADPDAHPSIFAARVRPDSGVG